MGIQGGKLDGETFVISRRRVQGSERRAGWRRNRASLWRDFAPNRTKLGPRRNTIAGENLRALSTPLGGNRGAGRGRHHGEKKKPGRRLFTPHHVRTREKQ